MLLFIQAAIIAFTSDFVQKKIYEYSVAGEDVASDNSTYVEWSLSTFRTSDFDKESLPSAKTEIAMFGDYNDTEHYCRFEIINLSSFILPFFPFFPLFLNLMFLPYKLSVHLNQTRPKLWALIEKTLILN